MRGIMAPPGTSATPAPTCTGTAVFMDTIVSLVVVHRDRDADCQPAMQAAFARFAEVEQRCSRFDPDSELSRLTASVGMAVEVSHLLYTAVAFAVNVAAASGGAFDPAVGRRMELHGFDRNYRSGQQVQNTHASTDSSYRDVELDAGRRTVMLRQPLALDLGAVAKGLAIDLAAQELSLHHDFAIDAGGDLFVSGLDAEDRPWPLGVIDPRSPNATCDLLALSDAAVCTSGDYERPGRDGGHHLLQPKTGQAVTSAVSATVVAPTAMQADTLATAAFVLGPAEGIHFLESQGVEGLIVSAALEHFATSGWARHRAPIAVAA